MSFSCTNTSTFLLLLLLLLCLLVFTFRIQAQILPSQKSFNHSITAIFVFGDSTVDPGNNNYIGTPFTSNFPPYGRDFVNQIPTGRFTNGKLPTDFIASYVGLKDYVPPYLDQTLSLKELMTGVSFASAGSGYDPLTPRLSNVIDMSNQLEYFKEYKGRLDRVIGKNKTENHIRQALFIISAGTNDFVVNYFTVPIRRKKYDTAEYQQFVLQNLRKVIQGLWELGARKFIVVGLPPMGCLPFVITLNSPILFPQRSCIDSMTSVARDYNKKLQAELADIQKSYSSYRDRSQILYADIYQSVLDIVQHNSKYGFEEGRNGCCGTGLIEASFLCNPKSLVCPDASKYVFWDSIHPTERTYYLVVKALLPTIDSFLNN